MEQTKALNALEPFLALSKSATSPRAAADLIVRATSAPNTFIFTELLQTPQIQALASSDEYAPYLTLLQIFSHGTYSTYTSTPGLPALNEAQRLKLRQLSLLTLAKKDAGPPALDYASLQKELDLPSRQALEELVISDVYAGLLKAQLDPKASLVRVHSVSPLRDVAPSAVGGLLSSLQAWATRCEATLESLSCQMAQLRADADRRAARAARHAEETYRLVENEQQQQQLQQQQQQQHSQKGGHIPPGHIPSSSARRCRQPASRTTHPTNTNTNPYFSGGDGSGSSIIGALSSTFTSVSTSPPTREMLDHMLTRGDSGDRFRGAPPDGPGAAHLQMSGGGGGGRLSDGLAAAYGGGGGQLNSGLAAAFGDGGGGLGGLGGLGGGLAAAFGGRGAATLDVDDEDDLEGIEGKNRAGKRKFGDRGLGESS